MFTIINIWKIPTNFHTSIATEQMFNTDFMQLLCCFAF